MASRKSGAGQRIPTLWLFTDERLGGRNPADPLWRAVRNLPRGSGILFRHYGWSNAERVALLVQLQALARRRGLKIAVSRLPQAPGAAHAGVHRPAGDRSPAHGRFVTAAAHDAREVAQAFARGADMVFLSPVFPTRSHPGATALGPARFGLIARQARGPVLALGGMSRERARRLKPLGAAGFGAIDYWVRA
ncbi:thiamine phosphate synthase [Sandaracinobacter sp. RS1-74]|uniref:thiamine phosphate synthase n=1 Tax=Sandaracinobacteroides sayramensis TaxID=2913411 RepID=UPI001EDA3D76|nr:thiamine phosphate synthase [Sandaracinobacteroides sayramensis]MCG2840580.1 thiamine phosphate synthase [Sandaracinobacteroides sayramensis]